MFGYASLSKWTQAHMTFSSQKVWKEKDIKIHTKQNTNLKRADATMYLKKIVDFMRDSEAQQIMVKGLVHQEYYQMHKIVHLIL